MEKIKARVIKKPVRLPSTLSVKIEDMVKAVNAVLNPGQPLINWFSGYENAKAAVAVRDGAYIEEESEGSIRFGGEITDSRIENLKVVAYNGWQGGIYVEGANSKVTLKNAVISLSGNGKGVGGPGTGAAVKNQGSLTLRNAMIDSAGKSRFCTVAEQFSELRVYDSILIGHGIPYGEGYESPSELMATPPPPLEISGNCRTHCTMSNSSSYFYNSKIISDGWGALSTETAEGFVYLEANDCEVIVTKQGYGAYADPDCHDYFNRCNFDIDGMAAIIAGEGDMTFVDCTTNCSTYLGLMHCVNGVPEEVGTLIYKGGRIQTGQEVIKIKSHNAQLEFYAVSIHAGNNILVHTVLNDDPCKTKPGDAPYGVNVSFTDMEVAGDLIHEDLERAMWIYLKSASLKGVIVNGNLSMDVGSRWLATGDSTVNIITDVYPSQIDALYGVTITAWGEEAGTYNLISGGKLVIMVSNDGLGI